MFRSSLLQVVNFRSGGKSDIIYIYIYIYIYIIFVSSLSFKVR